MMGVDRPMVQTNSLEPGSVCPEGERWEANATSELHGTLAAASAAASNIQSSFQQKSSQLGFESRHAKERRRHSRTGFCCEYLLQMECCPLGYGHWVMRHLGAQEVCTPRFCVECSLGQNQTFPSHRTSFPPSFAFSD